MKDKQDKQIFIVSVVLIVEFVMIICLIFATNYLNKRTTYNELTYYDFNISYDDDNYCYKIFTDDKTYTISEKRLIVKYDSENYIVVYDNNYDWYYNKAILFIGVGDEK